MTEVEKTEYCKLWSEARALAMDRGFTMSLICPLEEVCKGPRCQIMDESQVIIYQAKPNEWNDTNGIT